MKTIIRLSIVLAAVAIGTRSFAAAFDTNNIVVYRIGGNATGGSAATLTNRGNVVWLDEWTPNLATRIQSIQLRTNFFGADSALIGSGTAFGSGLITRSVDGRFILVCGYGVDFGVFTNTSLQGNEASSVPRVVGLVDGNGNQDTTTTFTNNDFNSAELRAAASTDGTNLWTSADAGGTQYARRGAIDSSQVQTTAGNTRQINIVNNQLYFDVNNPSVITQSLALCTNNISNATTNGLPTVTNNAAVGFVRAVNAGSPQSFAFFKLNNAGTAPIDTLYIADSSPSNQVLKYSSSDGTNWVNNGAIVTVSVVGLAGRPEGSGVRLWISGGGATLTGGDGLLTFHDGTGYNAAPTNNPVVTPIQTANPAVAFRGIALAPVAGGDLALPSGAGRLSVGPVIDVFASALTSCSDVTETDIYSLANFGTTSIGWTATANTNWVSFNSTSGTLSSGGSINVTVTLNGNVTGLTAATNTALVTFSNVTSAVGSTTRPVHLFLHPQTITPATDYTTSGNPGGPFTPSNKVYTVKTGPAITLNVIKENASTWLNLGTTTVSMPTCGSTIITASINQAVASGLAAADYTDTITFSNATAGTVIDTRNVLLQVGFRYFCDDFSTYDQNQPLAGQNAWVSFGGSANEPTVTNNAVYTPAYGGAPTTGDEPYKNFPQLTASNNPTANMFCSMSITVTSAAPLSTASPSRIWTFFQNNNSLGFARDSLTVRDTGGNTQFVFAIRNNGIPANTNIFGTTPLNYNQAYTVIVQGPADNTNSYVYVNPVSSVLDTNTAYVKMHVVSGTDFNVGSVQLGNVFNSAAFNYQAGIAISRMCVSTNYECVFNFNCGGGGPGGPYDIWASAYGLSGANKAGGADPDGDGMSNTNEFLAGFNPVNSAAYLHILSVTRTNSNTDIRIDYLGASGDSTYTGGPSSRTNVLESAPGVGPSGSFSTNNFTSTGITQVLSSGTGLGTQAFMVHPGGATNQPSRYYRVRVIVP